jgi:hypothetical protein
MQGVRSPKAKAGEIHTWTEAAIAQFEAWHPVGSTRPARNGAVALHGAAPRRCRANGSPARHGWYFVDPAGEDRQPRRNPAASGADRDYRRDTHRRAVDVSDERRRRRVPHPPGSATCSASGATKPICQSAVPRTGSAKQLAGGSPRRVAASTRLPPSAVTKASPKCGVTPNAASRAKMAKSAMATVTAAFPERRS